MSIGMFYNQHLGAINGFLVELVLHARPHAADRRDSGLDFDIMSGRIRLKLPVVIFPRGRLHLGRVGCFFENEATEHVNLFPSPFLDF